MLTTALFSIAAVPRSAFGEVNHKAMFTAGDPLVVGAGSWRYTQIDAPAAWLASSGYGDPVTVAVLDGGLATDHEDLAGQLWDNPDDLPNGIDDDDNGVVDDVHGISIIGGDTSADLSDGDGHGTNVAGIIAATANNGLGLAGLAPSAKLMVVKVLNESGAGSESDILNGMYYAITHGAKIINVSLGVNTSAFSDAMAAMIDLAEANDVLIVAAAGNNGTDNDLNPVYPASSESPAVVSVAATDSSGARPTFSNWGATSVDIAAPGADLTSTLKGGGYGLVSGTSMAAPHVTGAAAFLMAQRPTLTLPQVRAAILGSAHTSASWTGLNATGGVLDMHSALTTALSLPDAAPVNIVAPTFEGSVHRVGQPWLCQPGKWNAAATQFEYTWTINSVVVATTQTITPTLSQDGQRVICQVTGVNPSGVRVVAAKAESWVSPPLPRLDAVEISPSPQVGKVVKCKATGYGQQYLATWFINGQPVDFALTYRVPDVAAGKVLSCSTRLVNRISETSEPNTATAPVPWPKPTPVAVPKVTGSRAGKPIKCAVTWKFKTTASFGWSRDRRPIAAKTQSIKTSKRDRKHVYTCVARAIGPGGSSAFVSRAVKLK